MQIEWELEHEMPAAFYQEVKLAAGQSLAGAAPRLRERGR